MAKALFTALFLSGGHAVRPLQPFLQLTTEVVPPDDTEIGEVNAVGWGASAIYPPCAGLPQSGSHVLDALPNFSSSCSWRGEGLTATLKKPLIFEGSLVLTGDIQILGAQKLDGACITVLGNVSLISTQASFVGCYNQVGTGGGIFVQENLIASNSDVRFENCTAKTGGGGYDSKNTQVSRSRLLFENCHTEYGDGGGAFVRKLFSLGPNSSAQFRNCWTRRYGHGGGLLADDFVQEHSEVFFDDCRSNSGGCAYVNHNFSLGTNSSAHFRGCAAHHEGGGLHAERFTQSKSEVHFNSCFATHYGGCARLREFKQGPNSAASFRSCEVEVHHGGGLFASDFAQEQSTVLFEDSWAGEHGGCMYAVTFSQESSSADFQNCTSYIDGGGAKVGRLHQRPNSFLRFQNCTAMRGGGARVVEDFRQGPYSSAHFVNCTATSTHTDAYHAKWMMYGGGGLLADNFTQEAESKAFFETCTAEIGGGANVRGSFRQGSRSSAQFRGCVAKRGGGVYVPDFIQEEHSIVLFEKCKASFDVGGGACVRKQFHQGPNSSAQFRSCDAARQGGALWSDTWTQEPRSAALFENCAAVDGGGGASNFFRQGRDSSAEFQSCTAKRGGGLFAVNYKQEAGSSAAFRNCTARFGGGLRVISLGGNGSLQFKTCRAEAGGGLGVPENGKVLHGGSLSFEACSAASTGGGIFSSAVQGHFVKLRFEQCDARVGAAAFAATAVDNATVHIQELTLANDEKSDVKDFAVAGSLQLGSVRLRTESKFGISVVAQDLLLEDVMDCTGTTSCLFSANTSESRGFRCPLGTGVVNFSKLEDFGCFACKPGDMQLFNVSNRSCHRCPDGGQCSASELKMEPGLMVDMRNVSRTFHCPNEAACAGGEFSHGAVKVPMCEDGFQGQGCADCSDGYAMADSSVLVCKACRTRRSAQVVQWILFLSQRTFLFALAATSAIGAKTAGDLKHSSIYLNQLMAFATISNTIMAAVLQTQTAKHIRSESASFLFDATDFVAQTASAGQGSLHSVSSQCLLSYIGFEKTVWGPHLLDVAVAALLVATLSLMKDFRAALIAGLNCFLPTMAADFGKYLVCYRLEPEGISGLQGLQCPYLPRGAGLAGGTQVVGGLTLFMTAALWSPCPATWSS
ncbi:pmpB [Symbiodinium sp. CCMP2592]|nr:pmpB [Symbiodinium sp. CCMP2592]